MLDLAGQQQTASVSTPINSGVKTMLDKPITTPELAVSQPTSQPAQTPAPTLTPVHKWEMKTYANTVSTYLDGKYYGGSQPGYEMLSVSRASPNDIIIKDGVIIQQGAGVAAGEAGVQARIAAEQAKASARAAQAALGGSHSIFSGGGGDGTYTSPTGQQISGSQAMSSGIIDNPMKPVSTPAPILAPVKMDTTIPTQGSIENLNPFGSIINANPMKPISTPAPVVAIPVNQKPPTQEQFDYTGRTSYANGLVSMTPQEIATQKAQNEILKSTGLPIYNPITQANEKINANIQKQQDVYNQQKFEQGATYREYTSPNAPLSFKIQEGIKNLAANVGSFDVLSKNIEQVLSYNPFDKTQKTTEVGLFGTQGVKETSDYLKAKESYLRDVSKIADTKNTTDKLVGFGGMLVESPVLQSEVGGYALGGLFAGGSAVARTALSGASKESGAIVKFASSKLPESVGTRLFPEVAPTGFTIERGLTYAGKIPSLVPSALKTAEKLVEPTIAVGGLGYIGYDVATSKTKGEAGAKIAILGIGLPYAKAGFETGSQLVRTYAFALK